MTRAAQSSVVAEDYMIESGDPGIRLFVRNKHPRGMTQYRSDKTVLYVHGATQAASSTFDLKIDQESWMDYIAGRGYDVYLVDGPPLPACSWADSGCTVGRLLSTLPRMHPEPPRPGASRLDLKGLKDLLVQWHEPIHQLLWMIPPPLPIFPVLSTVL